MESIPPPPGYQVTQQRIILRHSGRWDKAEYIDGDEQLIYVLAHQLSFDQLVGEIHDVMQSDPSTADYLLFYMTSTITERRRIKVALKSDRDLVRMLYEDKNEPIVYIVEKGKQTPTANDASHMHQSRTHRHTNLSGQSSTSVDDDLLGDKDTRMPMKAKLFKDDGQGHIDRILDRIAVPLNITEPAVPLNITEPASENDGRLSVGATFDSKDSLKTEVKKYHMKNQAKYYVKRSCSKRVNFICKHGNGCSFMLRASTRRGVWRVIKVNKEHTCRNLD